MNINKIIREEVNKFILNESLSKILYHFTSIYALKNIIFNDTFRLAYAQPGTAEYEYTKNGKYQYFMSFTRQMDGRLGFSLEREVRIEVDGDRLSQNFRGEPMSYFSSLDGYMKKVNNNRHYIPTELQYQEENENEDRLFTNRPSISNLKRYIKRIDILLSSQSNAKFVKWMLTDSEYKDKTFVYDDDNEFRTRGKYIINDKILNDTHEQFSFSGTYDGNSDYTLRINNNNAYPICEDISHAIIFILLNQDIDPQKCDYNQLRENVYSILKKYKINEFIDTDKLYFNNIIDMIRIFAPKGFSEMEFDKKTECLLDARRDIFSRMSGLGNYKDKRLISNISNLVKHEILNIK